MHSPGMFAGVRVYHLPAGTIWAAAARRVTAISRSAGLRRAHLYLVLPLFGLAGLALSFAVPFHSFWQAFPRLFVAFFVVVIGPGYFLTRLMPAVTSLDNVVTRYVLSLSVGYVLLTVLCGILILFHLNSDDGILILLSCEVLLSALAIFQARHDVVFWRQLPSSFYPLPVLGILMLAAVGYAAWVFGAPIEGEEIVDLGIIRKLAELSSFALNNLGHQPNQILTYILAPFGLLVVLTAKISGVPLVAAYVKLRPFWFLSAACAFWCLAAALFRNRLLAGAALILMLLLVLIDPDPWSWPGSLFPYGRRGSFAGGVLLPAVMWIFTVLTEDERKLSPLTFVLPGLLVISLVMTHGTEAFFSLWCAGGLVLCAALWPVTGISRLRSVITAGSAAAGALVFRVVHSGILPEIGAYDAMFGGRSLGDVLRDLHHPIVAFLGGMSGVGRYLITNNGSAAVWAILPIAFLPLLIVRYPRAGLVLWCMVVPPLTLLSTPIGADFLVALSAPDIQFAISYFEPFGILIATVLVTDVAVVIDRRIAVGYGSATGLAASTLLGCGLLIVSYGVMTAIMRMPTLLTFVAAFGGIAAYYVQRRQANLTAKPPEQGQLRLIAETIAIALPIFVGMKFFPADIPGSDRQNLAAAFIDRRTTPSVLDWVHYYPILQQTARPPIDIPLSDLEALRRVVRPGSIVLYDPAHSYALPALLNVYTINSAQLLSSDLEYFKSFVVYKDNLAIHPIFNSEPGVSDREICFLASGRIDYIIANPSYSASVAAKISRFQQFVQLILTIDGFQVYQVDPKLRIAAARECHMAARPAAQD